MTLSLPYTLVALTPENINHVQANFQALADSFPLAVGPSNRAAVPRCHVYRSTSQTISNNTRTAVAFPLEVYDTGTLHDTVTNNSRITCPVDGLYQITGTATFSVNTTGTRFIDIAVNGGSLGFALKTPYKPAIQSAMLSFRTQARLVATDYVELMVEQSSGGNLDVLSGTRFQVHWVSP